MLPTFAPHISAPAVLADRSRGRTALGTSGIIKFLPRQFGELIFLLIFAPA